ncbi:1-deoxy-D-xylulose-5-phosphate reductoisomerase [Maricaulis sp.]|uniref:1-deoxy-D-xylulose-5-phosphate reductoisomerase n=1 Tax=Maricaulis sp. TaxID=1486257 RepID=UPI001B0FA737|nr:1-deoxy-D-xylulose-5-phosphate reductoisomerase [Maricaulis sp.]MBO6797794.1 1-deoxy-D-xylulose-5-phosphate reductoisomerase [Maricaulis sp.]
MAKTRKISVLGATGSVGAATLDLIERAPAGAFELAALTAHTNVDELIRLALKFRPEMVALADSSGEAKLRDALDGLGIAIACGEGAVVEAARRPADWTMAAIVGAAGLRPTLEALKQGNALAFANKECLVCAGGLFMQAATKAGTELLPVDSEHNAIFQVFDNRQKKQIDKITLTASGGPFRTWTSQQMDNARRADALAHPTWEMGAKITIDSATMMNKGLEIIEACWLFDLPETRVDVAVHPQSIVHGLVHYADGSVLAQMGSPDMRTPIANALSWPQRMQAPVKPLDLCAISRLDFEAPDLARFPAMRLAREAVGQGGILPAVLNAANEIAVDAFLAERIGFLDIAGTVENVMEAALGDADMPQQLSSFDDVYAIDHRARELARDLIAVAAA